MPDTRIVSLAPCSTYDLSEVAMALRRVLEPWGGISSIVEPGQRVLLKPNLLMPTGPHRAITTHPVVLEAMVDLVREAGGEPTIADSPGGPLHTRAGMHRLYRDTGLEAMARRKGVPLHVEADAIDVPVPDGRQLASVELLKAWHEADAIIALPKLKTHGFTTITGATKILFGLVPGLNKLAYHARLPELDRFCDMLLDIVACVRPALFVMDAVVALEGNGPSLQGSPRQIGALLASRDAVALDATVCQIIGVDPDRLALFRAATRRGWWPVDITVEGTPVADVAAEEFRLPDTADASTRPAAGWLPLWVTRAYVPRPVPQPGQCTGCGTCVRSCPRGAIAIVDGLAKVDDQWCIRCYCCHEMCPEAAIELEWSRLGRCVHWLATLRQLVESL